MYNAPEKRANARFSSALDEKISFVDFFGHLRHLNYRGQKALLDLKCSKYFNKVSKINYHKLVVFLECGMDMIEQPITMLAEKILNSQ